VRFIAILSPRHGGSFEKKVSRLTRKFPNLQADLTTAWAELVGPPPVPIPSGQRVVVMQRTAPHVVLKVRVPSSDMGKGASGGFRVVLLERQPDHWQPILIYPKNEQEDVQPSEVLKAAVEETAEPSAPVDEVTSDAPPIGSSGSEPPVGEPLA
jgi:hypothetical protein